MYRYTLYGLIIESDLEFKQLISVAPEGEPDIYISKGHFPDMYKSEKVYYSNIGDREAYLSNDTCYLYITDGKRITYEQKKTEPGYLGTYILGWGMSMLVHQRGDMAIHCSAMHKGGEAIMVSGSSGAGKSTITEELLSRGWGLMADDIAVVRKSEGGYLASPAFPYQKLCRDAALKNGLALDELIYIDEEKDKFLVPYKGEFVVNPLPLKALIFLDKHEGDEIVCSEIAGIDKVRFAHSALFLSRLMKNKDYTANLAQSCLELAAKIPFYYFSRPNGLDTVKDIADGIEDML